MRAVTINHPDGPDAITVTERAVREAGAGEVRVHVSAAAVNPTDVLLWRTLGGGSLQPPFTAGMDIAGTVESLGDGVERLAVGDAVMAVVNPRRPEGGAQAELVIVPAPSVVRVSDVIAPAEASTLPMNGLTALEGLEMLDLPIGATLAVTGGAGLLASYVIALAKQRGLTVIADAKPEDRSLVAGFGADVVIARGDGFVAAVLGAVPGGVDAIFDTAVLRRAVLPAIRAGGAIAVIRGWDDGGDPEREVTVHAVSVGRALENTAWLELLAGEAAAGRIPLRVHGIYPPERATEAYTLMEAGGIRGRAVIAF